MLPLKVNGEISVPFGKATAVELVFYFCTKRRCPKRQVHLIAEEDINQAETAKF